MTLPSSGQITWDQVVVEIGYVSGTSLASNHADVYTLTGKTPGSTLVFPTDFYGKSWTDTTPDAFDLGADVTDADASTVYTAPNTITVAGINSPATVTISGTGAQMSINGGGWTTTPTTVSNGNTVAVRITSGSSENGSVRTATLTIGDVSDTWSVTNKDTIANSFNLGTNTSSAATGTYYVAPNTITVAGLGTGTSVTATISGTGAEMQKNGGGYGTSSFSVQNGDTIQVRILSSESTSTARTATLTVGTVSDTWTVTTGTSDTTPTTFTMPAVTTALTSGFLYAKAIEVSGLNGGTATVTISGTGGTMNKNGGSWTTTSFTVVDGDIVGVRAGLSSTGTVRTITLTIGTVSATWVVTVDSSADGTPNSISGAFTDQTLATPSTQYTSNYITVSGLGSGVACACTLTGTGSPQVSINDGPWRTSATNQNIQHVVNGDTIRVRATASASSATSTTAVINIGGVTDTYTVTTYDYVPAAFSFTDVTNATRSTVYTSNTLTVSGITGPASISVTGGEYQINGGSWTSASGSITNGQTVKVRVTSSSSYSTAVNVVLTIGGVSDTYTVTTQADTVPDAFTFTDVTGASLSTVYTSNQITVSGIAAAASISITGGTYSVNGGSYVSTSGTVNNGDTVTVRVTSSGSASTAVNATLTIGGVSDTYTVTTLAQDTTPDSFSFTNLTSAAQSYQYTSNQITVSGINAAANISISGGSATFSINGGAYTSTSTTVNNGDVVMLRMTSSASLNTTVSTTLTIGGVSDTWSVKTNATDITPGATNWGNINLATNVLTGVNSNVTISGISTSITIKIRAISFSSTTDSGFNLSYRINNGTYTNIGSIYGNGDVGTFTVSNNNTLNFRIFYDQGSFGAGSASCIIEVINNSANDALMDTFVISGSSDSGFL